MYPHEILEKRIRDMEKFTELIERDENTYLKEFFEENEGIRQGLTSIRNYLIRKDILDSIKQSDYEDSVGNFFDCVIGNLRRIGKGKATNEIALEATRKKIEGFLNYPEELDREMAA